MKEIPLRGKPGEGLVALVDDADFDLVNQYSWYAWVNPKVPDIIYAFRVYRRSGCRKTSTQKMHALLTGQRRIDHKNHNGLDNQRDNMRKFVDGQNNMNARKRSGTSSRFKGVSWASREQRWKAALTLDGRQTCLGYYQDESEAAKAYNDRALLVFGEFAHLNDLGG
jgi:hypothetical protein